MSDQRSTRKAIVPFLFLAFIFTPGAVFGQRSLFHLSPLFTDNMVFQQQSLSPVWGNGTPGTTITLQASWGAKAATKVNSDSSWSLKIRTPKAGGPFEVTIGHDDTIFVLKNVLAGEVWLCSGQSNMEMPLAGWPPKDTVLYSTQEIEHANRPDIRFFSVRKTFSAIPEFTCDGSWAVSSPATSRDFSATAFFFGKKLYETLHVPIGLIHSSWGGTKIESWIGGKYLSRFPEYDTLVQKIANCADGQRQILKWLHQYPVVDMQTRVGEDRWAGLSFRDEACASRT